MGAVLEPVVPVLYILTVLLCDPVKHLLEM